MDLDYERENPPAKRGIVDVNGASRAGNIEYRSIISNTLAPSFDHNKLIHHVGLTIYENALNNNDIKFDIAEAGVKLRLTAFAHFLECKKKKEKAPFNPTTEIDPYDAQMFFHPRDDVIDLMNQQRRALQPVFSDWVNMDKWSFDCMIMGLNNKQWHRDYINFEVALFWYRWKRSTQNEKSIFCDNEKQKFKKVTLQEINQSAKLQDGLGRLLLNGSYGRAKRYKHRPGPGRGEEVFADTITEYFNEHEDRTMYTYTPHSILDSGFYKVPFEFVTDLIKVREIFIMDGFAYVQTCRMAYCFVARLIKILNGILKMHDFNVQIHDERAIYLWHLISITVTKLYIVPEMTVAQIRNDMCVQCYPMCMHRITESTVRKGEIKNDERVQYFLTLKSANVPIDTVKSAIKSVYKDKDHFEKEIEVKIDELMGDKSKWSAPSCSSTMNKIKNPSTCDGCPYVTMDDQWLGNLMHRVNIKEPWIIRILSEKTPMDRCSKHLKLIMEERGPVPLSQTYTHRNAAEFINRACGDKQ